jgi:hypothetical protein
MKHCIICNAPLKIITHSGRRRRRDTATCSATCRKRLQRRKASGSVVVFDLPGQQLLPLSTDDHQTRAALAK